MEEQTGYLPTIEIKRSEDLFNYLDLSFSKEVDAIGDRTLLNKCVTIPNNSLIEDISALHLVDVNDSCKNDIDKMPDKIPGFISIDKAVSRILNNLSYRKGR